MAHFAELDENNYVKRVIVISNEDCKDNDGNENELVGAGFCARLFGGNWKQTSYNSTIRKNYAGEGYFYDVARDAFIPPQPFASWILDETTCHWLPPIPMPSDGGLYRWDEATQTWVLVT